MSKRHLNWIVSSICDKIEVLVTKNILIFWSIEWLVATHTLSAISCVFRVIILFWLTDVIVTTLKTQCVNSSGNSALTFLILRNYEFNEVPRVLLVIVKKINKNRAVRCRQDVHYLQYTKASKNFVLIIIKAFFYVGLLTC